MIFLIVVPISDLAQVCLNALLLIKLTRSINSRGRGISSKVLLIVPLPFLVFLLLLPSFLCGLGIPFRTRGVIWFRAEGL